jgi:YD repeat-containing protein
MLSTVITTGLGQQYSFTYGSDNSGALAYTYLPYGGYIGWVYDNVTYTNGATFRQVQTRNLSKDGINVTSYPFSHESSTLNLHSYTIIDDPGGVGEKYWAFSLSGANTGMVTQYQGRQLPGPVTLTQNDFTWQQDANGNLFIQSALTTQDIGQSYQAQKRTDQNVDVHGNVTQVFQYDFNSLTTPARVYSYTYLNSSNYTSLYIFNRLTQATLSTPTLMPTLLATNTYDNGGSGGFALAPSGVTVWDSAYASIAYHGLVTSSTTLSGTSTYTYDQTGTMLNATLNGVSTNITASSTNGYAVPSQITTGSLTQSMDWSTFLGLTSSTGPNSDVATINYDSYGRPYNSISVFGAQTTYTYSSAPYSSSNAAWSESTIDGRFTKTTLDGLGPHADRPDRHGLNRRVPGGYRIWILRMFAHRENDPDLASARSRRHAGLTTYSYDGIGRTTSVLSPDGASTTRYFYAGNTVTTTDPAGAWKTYTMDAFGNVTQVTEPDPTTSVTGINAIGVASGMTNSVDAAYPATVTSSGGGGSGTWYNSSWGYRTPVTVSHTMVSGGSSLTNFPVLVSVTNANLKTVANGGYVGKSDGSDILFTASDELPKLNHEIESYNPATGNVIAWVQVPSLSNSTDTVLYAYYGNASASNQQNPTGVWDSNYTAVYHLGLNGALSLNDSTTNGNTLTNTNSVVSANAQISTGASFNGSNNYLSAASLTNPPTSGGCLYLFLLNKPRSQQRQPSFQLWS